MQEKKTMAIKRPYLYEYTQWLGDPNSILLKAGICYTQSCCSLQITLAAVTQNSFTVCGLAIVFVTSAG